MVFVIRTQGSTYFSMRCRFGLDNAVLMYLRFFLVGTLLAIAIPVHANQMFRAGGSSGTSCPSGSQYKGSGFCKAKKSEYQFFPASGAGTSCPSGSQYKGSGFCLRK